MMNNGSVRTVTLNESPTSFLCSPIGVFLNSHSVVADKRPVGETVKDILWQTSLQKENIYFDIKVFQGQSRNTCFKDFENDLNE